MIHLFLKEFNDKFSKNFRGVSDEAKAILWKHHWSGNIRELRNAVERIVLMENDKWILPQTLWSCSKIPLIRNKNPFLMNRRRYLAKASTWRKSLTISSSRLC